MSLFVLVVSFAIKHDRSKREILFDVVDKVLHVGNVAVADSHTIVTKNYSVIIFAHRLRIINNRHRILPIGAISYKTILCYLVSRCGAWFVNFSSPNDVKGEGVEERTQKFLGNERSEYEPKANKVLDRIKDWLIRHYALQIIMALNLIVLITLLVLELEEYKK
jgi:hypothetical protein